MSLSLEFFQVFNGFYEVYLSNKKTLIIYFDSFIPVKGEVGKIELTQITDLDEFISSKKTKGFQLVEIELSSIIGNKKIENR